MAFDVLCTLCAVVLIGATSSSNDVGSAAACLFRVCHIQAVQPACTYVHNRPASDLPRSRVLAPVHRPPVINVSPRCHMQALPGFAANLPLVVDRGRPAAVCKIRKAV
jgi:hypothetical protein